MEANTIQSTTLAYKEQGSGFPVVFIHGLTFNRDAWQPIIDRLPERFRCVAVDLPGHGESAGRLVNLEAVGVDVHRLLSELQIDRPVVIGHSLGAILATMYAASYPVAGVVNVDQPLDIEPFARMLRQLEPALHGPDFSAAFEPIRQSIGVEMLPEPLRSSIRSTQTVRQDLVLSYWNETLQRSPEDLQAMIDEATRGIEVPYLAVFGRRLSAEEGNRFRDRLSKLELEEWQDQGHMVHLMDPDRFARLLTTFLDRCNGELQR